MFETPAESTEETSLHREAVYWRMRAARALDNGRRDRWEWFMTRAILAEEGLCYLPRRVW